MQHLISKISLHKVDNAATSLKHRISWSFPYNHLQELHEQFEHTLKRCERFHKLTGMGPSNLLSFR